MTLGEPYS